jgi:hypothetical protein
MKEYICECHNKKWPDKTHYNRHLNSKILTGEPRKTQKVRCDKKEYVCGLCGKSYRNNYDLNLHTSCKTKNTIKVKQVRKKRQKINN